MFRARAIGSIQKSVLMSDPAGIPYRPSPNLLLRVLTLLVFLEAPLKAYADPGSGLLLWQLAGAFFLGVAYHIRKFFADRKNKK